MSKTALDRTDNTVDYRVYEKGELCVYLTQRRVQHREVDLYRPFDPKETALDLQEQKLFVQFGDDTPIAIMLSKKKMFKLERRKGRWTGADWTTYTNGEYLLCQHIPEIKECVAIQCVIVLENPDGENTGSKHKLQATILINPKSKVVEYFESPFK